jgi:hypothetical protein
MEMAAGALLWTALLALGRGDPADIAVVRRERRLLEAATVAVVLLAGLRTLGPLWVLLVLGCLVALRGPRTVLAVAGRHRARVAVATALAAATFATVLVWGRGAVPVPPGALNDDVDSSWGQALRWPNWILSSIGAFPFRDQPAPLLVHVLVLLVLMTMLVAAVRHGAGDGRRAVLLAVLLSLAVPSVLVALTLEARGGVWQGRYLLPFLVGVPVLAGLVLDRTRWRADPSDPRPQVLAVTMLGIGHTVSVVHVLRAELRREVSATDPGWVHPPVLVAALLVALGWVVLATAVRHVAAQPPRQERAQHASAETGAP